MILNVNHSTKYVQHQYMLDMISKLSNMVHSKSLRGSVYLFTFYNVLIPRSYSDD